MVEQGSSVDLHCLTGYQLPPQSDIVWSRSDGQVLDARHLVTGGVLRIINAQPEDGGQYLCEVSFTELFIQPSQFIQLSLQILLFESPKTNIFHRLFH